MPKITVFYSEPPRKRNRMFQFMSEIPMWMWMWMWVMVLAGCTAILVLDYLM